MRPAPGPRPRTRGLLAGADAVFDTAFNRAGILRVSTIADMFNMSDILAKQPQPMGPSLAMITNAGGPGVMATDALMLAGGQLATLSPETMEELNKILPHFWSHANPIDILGDATPERYRKVVEICAKDPNIHGLLLLLTPQAMTDPTETARQLVPFAKLERKPILATWMGGTAVHRGQEVLNEAGIPTFDSPEPAISAFLHMVQYRHNQELLYETPPALPEDITPDQVKVRKLIATARAEKRTMLTEVEAKEVLAAYGIPVTPTVPCSTADEAVAAARKMGFPVVVKLLSRTITHKTDVGGVKLNLHDDEAVRNAFLTIEANVAGKGPNAFDGVSVQPMVIQKGFELIVGSSIDRQFGPVVLFGAGGIMVEVFKDSALALPPLNRTLARRLIERTKISHALAGVRGQKPVDVAGLESLLVRFSQLVADFLDIAEIDINPLLASPERVVALDARVLLAPADLPENKQPRLAIRPYPNQFVSQFTLPDGSAIVVRPIRPEDAPLIVELHAAHSERTIRLRFFSLVKMLSRDSLIRLCQLDYDREMALVAEQKDSAGKAHILAVSRYTLHPETGIAEFAVVVTDAWQGKGIGWQLMQRLIDVARQNGVKQLVGPVLRENATMLQLVQELGFAVHPTDDDTLVQAVLDLAP